MAGRRAAILFACFAASSCAHAGGAQPQAMIGSKPDAQAAARTGLDDASDRQLLLTLRMAPPHYRPDVSYGGYARAPGREARRRVALAMSAAHGLRLLDDWAIPALGVDCYVLEAPSAEARARELATLAADPRVESVQAMHVFHALADPPKASKPQPTNWRLHDLHALTTGRGVLLAIVDSGADTHHPDLLGQSLKARNFIDGDPYSAEPHGTAVAGIIAARVDDGIGIAGVAPGAQVLALRACTQTLHSAGAACTSFNLAKALQFALQAKVQVLNLSLTGPPDPLLARLLDVALVRGITVVAAVDAETRDGGFPATHPGVLAVAGMHGSGSLPSTFVRAPDRGIPAPRSGGGWALVSGTSFAAAQVSGLVALLRELAPRLSAADLRAAMSPPAELLLAREQHTSIDACAAVRRVARRCACRCAVAQATITVPRR